MIRIAVFLVAVCLSIASTVLAQDAVPSDILERTFHIKVGSHLGTAFGIDYGGKLYIVTAKHIVAGWPDKNVTIQLRRAEKWEDFHILRILFPPSNDVDIAVFETDKATPRPFGIKTAGEIGGVTMGQQVWFLGYPFEGIGSSFGSVSDKHLIPFIKRGTMSAIESSNPDAVVLFIDGFNNPGFSGGPILYWNFSRHVYEILGVVQGYRQDSAGVLVNGAQVNAQVLVNSGILVGYSIKHAIQAIEKGQQK